MRTKKRGWVWLLALVMTGCVPSWNAFYLEENLVFEEALLGSWRPVKAGDSSKENWVFTQGGEKRYQLVQTDDEGRGGTFDVRLFKLGDQLFLDLYLTKVDSDEVKLNAWAGFSLVPAHLLLKVEQIEPSLKIAAMSPDWMRKFLEKNPRAIAHRVVFDGGVVLAASTAELQQFVIAHLGEDEFFGGAMELKRR